MPSEVISPSPIEAIKQRVNGLNENAYHPSPDKYYFLKTLSGLKLHAENLRKNGTVDKATREDIRAAALELADSFEDPVQQALRIIFETSPPLVALRIAIEAGFLKHLKAEEPSTATALGELTKVDPTLIVRIMRILTAAKFANEVGVETYTANDLTKAFLQPGIEDAVRHGCDVVNVIFAKLPQFISNLDFQEPDNYTLGPHTFTFGKPLWKHLELEPAQSQLFDRMMVAFKRNRENWVDIFRFDEQPGNDLTDDQVLVIDIAGGHGHRLRDFKNKYSHAKGRLVLQDQAHVLPTPESNPNAFAGLKDCGIELVQHDIFKPQIISGARYYFFSAIFHGRPDPDCLKLLRNTASAMTKGYSRILINDFVIPERGVSLFQASFDLWMMADVTGKERTQKNWQNLFDQAGLKLVKIHTLGLDAVIEIELA